MTRTTNTTTRRTTNTHGHTMTGLRRIAGDTKGLSPYDGAYVQVNYDRETGRAWGDYHWSLGQNSWTRYHGAGILVIGNADRPMTMQQLADWIAETIRLSDMVQY